MQHENITKLIMASVCRDYALKERIPTEVRGDGCGYGAPGLLEASAGADALLGTPASDVGCQEHHSVGDVFWLPDSMKGLSDLVFPAGSKQLAG